MRYGALVLAMMLLSGIGLARPDFGQVALYRDFPVYPPDAATKYADSGAVHFKVPLTSYGYLDDARAYIEKAASEHGWQREQILHGEPEVWTYVREGDPVNVVWIYFNREAEPFETRPVTTYFSAPRGSIEYTFIDKNTLPTFHFKQIVTLTREQARDAYIELLKDADFDTVARKHSVRDTVENSLVRYPVCRLRIEQEVTRLMPGQVSDIYRDKDNYYYIVKLIKVTVGEEEIPYPGQNPEFKRPESARILQRWQAERDQAASFD